MSGGLRTSVKGYLIAKRLALTDPQAASDSVDKKPQDDSPPLPVPERSIASTSYGRRIGDGGILLRRFFLNELKTATWNFHPDNMVGEGGFGSVFKGWVDDNSSTASNPGKGMLIAVKRINQEGFLGHQQWWTEIYYLGRLRHPNLVKLLGYCFEDDHRLLVFEYIPRGGLDNHLFGRASYLQPLSWILRMKISLGAANVLAFLHRGEETVIHRDITSSNILLDSTYNVKLADFGLAKDVPAGDRSHVSTTVMGTLGYAAPEYIATGHLTAKCDVYGFEVVLLEMLCGRPSLDHSRPTGQQSLVEWARPYLASSKRRVLKVFDPRIKGQYSVAGALKAASLAQQCLSEDPEFRPNMNEAVKALEQLQESGDMGIIPRNEPCQSPRADSSDRPRSRSWISFMPSAYRQTPSRSRPNMNEVVKALEQLQECSDIQGSGIFQNESDQTPRAKSSTRCKSWISFRPSASLGS